MTTHDGQWYRDQMNTLEKQLTEADHQWFDDLRIYSTLGAFMRDEKSVNAQLYMMMTDLLAAEADGSDAPSLFGDDPKLMADTLLKELPPAKKRDIWKLLGIIIGIAWLTMLIGGGWANGGLSINFLAYIGVALLSIIMLSVIFWFMRTQIYTTVKLIRSKVGGFLVIWAIMAIYLGSCIAIALLTPPIVAWHVAYPWNIAVVVVCTAVAMVLALHEHDPLFTPLAFLALVVGIMTSLTMVWQATHFMSREWLAGIVISMTVVSYVIYILWMRHSTRGLKD